MVMTVTHDEFDYLRPETYEGAYSNVHGVSAATVALMERDIAFLATALRESLAEADELRTRYEYCVVEHAG